MLDLNAILNMTWKMLLAVVLGGLVGYERETHGRPAGLRTHILVCFGAALFTIVSIESAGVRFDPGRIAAQIVSGIGFLGAGTIIRQGSIIRGLTTAASLWSVAAIGMAVGMGGNTAYVAVVASVIVFATLSVLNQIEHKLISRSRYRDLMVTLADDRKLIAPLLNVLTEQGITLQGLAEEFREQGQVTYRIHLRLAPGVNVNTLTDKLATMSEIHEFNWA